MQSQWIIPIIGFLLIAYSLFWPKSVQTKATQLKRDAREIRRRWPDSEFTRHPVRRDRWAPAIGQACSIEQRLAIEWHDRLMQLSRPISLSLDFDGLMEKLDEVENEPWYFKLPLVETSKKD